MKIKVILLFLFLGWSSANAVPVFIESDGAPIIKGENGVYTQVIEAGFSSGSVAYVVDVRTRICLVKWISRQGPSSPILVDCENISRRDEWKGVVNWGEQ